MKHKFERLLLILLVLSNLALAACGPSPTQTPTIAPTAAVPATNTPLPAVPTEAPTAEPTAEVAARNTPEPTLAPTQAPTAEPTPTSQAADLFASQLAGLDIDTFFERSWRLLMLRDPEWVLDEGLGGDLALATVELTDISDAYQRETIAMQASVLELLRQYDRDKLTAEQQISYDVYEWYLQDKVEQEAFLYYDYPATYFPITAVHENILWFFTDSHPLANLQDAQNYVSRLQQVAVKFEQLFDGLDKREELGILPPSFASQWALYITVYDLAQAQATDTPFYTALENKLSDLDNVPNDQVQVLLDAAETTIAQEILPAYQELESRLEHMQRIGAPHDGVWQFEGGSDYYDFLLKHHTTTDLTADEIHNLGLQELERIHGEMRVVFDQLGYPQDESLVQLYNRVGADGGLVSGDQILSTYEQLIQEADAHLDPIFDIRPQAKIVVIGTDYGGYYSSGSLDGSRPGAFYASLRGQEERYGMPTLAYHEAIPGHHFQISLAQESDLPLFRNIIGFSAYAEGWALYAEYLAYEQGWYADDPYGNLGRLQGEAFRAARLVVDTGIHSQGWTFEQAVDFFIENVGIEENDSIAPYNEVARYVVWPGQATAYMIGMLKILELRQQVMDQLGDQFDLKEFHNVVLTNGSMPLGVLERLINSYIQEKLAEN